MRRDGLHFLIPDPAGPIDVADLRRAPNLPTSLVLDARDNAVQPWSTDYDGFCGPAGPVGTAIADAGPFVLRLTGVPTARRLWEMPVLMAHRVLADAVPPVGRDKARTVVWIVGALDHRTGVPFADLAPTPTDADPKALVEASLPRLREDAATGRTIVGLVARSEGAEAAVARLAEVLPETHHRFAVFDRLADVIEVLDEPTLPIPAPTVLPVPRSHRSVETPPTAPTRRPLRLALAAVALAAIAGAGVWAFARRSVSDAPPAPTAEAAPKTTVAATPDPPVRSPAPSEAPSAVDAPSAPPPIAPPASPRSESPIETGAIAPEPSLAPPEPKPFVSPAPTTTEAAEDVRPPEPPAEPRRDVVAALPGPTETASRTPVPNPAPRPMPVPTSRPAVATPPTPETAELRVWRLVAAPGSSCLQVFLGEAQPQRIELEVSPDGGIAPTRRTADLCGFDVAAGRGRRVAYDPAFLAATRERAAPPQTRRFLLMAGAHGRGLPRRWTLGVSGDGRADRTYEQGLAE